MRKAGFIRCKSNHRWKFHERRWCRCCQEDELIAMIQELDGETKVCMDHTGRYYPEQCIQNRIGILGMKNRRMLCNIGTELSEKFFHTNHTPVLVCVILALVPENCKWVIRRIMAWGFGGYLSSLGYFCEG